MQKSVLISINIVRLNKDEATLEITFPSPLFSNKTEKVLYQVESGDTIELESNIDIEVDGPFRLSDDGNIWRISA